MTMIEDPEITYVSAAAERITETVRIGAKVDISRDQSIAVLATRLRDPNYLTSMDTARLCSADEHLATLAMLAAVLLVERAGI